MWFGTVGHKNQHYPMDWVTKAEDLWFITRGKGGVVSDTGIYYTGTTFPGQNIRSYDLMVWGQLHRIFEIGTNLGIEIIYNLLKLVFIKLKKKPN